ncbi:lambda repressor-like predicted transcriptional regulator/tetratricopeptide (TPR) repeat protein [Nocardioides sp. HB32]
MGGTGGRLARPEVQPGSQRDLVDSLHALHHEAGWPSLRALAREAGCSHTTVATVFSSPKLPSWGVLELVVEAMGGDVDEFRRMWLAASGPASTPGSPIAGRRDELATVRRHLESGSGLLLVTGEAGMGKTRLVDTAAGFAAGSGRNMFVARGTCRPLSTQVPLLPIADVLRSAYQVDEGRWLEEGLAGCAPYVRAVLCRLLPELGEADDTPGMSADDWWRHRMFSAVSAAWTSLAAVRPLAVLVEDLHWADPSTLDLLEHLVSRGVDVPMVGTWRLEDPATSVATADWGIRVRRMPSVETFVLGPLSREETAVQLELLAGDRPAAELLERIYRRTRGQPLFTEQLAAHDDGQPLPELLADLLDRRIQGLGDPAWSIVSALGAADRSLTDSLLSELTQLPPTAFVAGLHELEARRLLRSAKGHEVELRHPLLAEAVRRHLVAHELVEEHRRLATALARTADPSPGEVAEQWQLGEDPAQEIVWRIRAAQAAGQRLAMRAAAAHWQRALLLWPGDDELAGSPPVRKCDVYLALMDALGPVDVLLAAAVAQEAMEDQADSESPDAAAIYQRAAEYQGNLGEQESALLLMDKALHIYEGLGPSADHVRALIRREWLLWSVGREEEGAATALLGAEMCALIAAPELHRWLLALLASYSAKDGDLDLALSRIREAARIQVPQPDPAGDVHIAIEHTVILNWAAADPDSVIAAARPALDVATAWGFDAHIVAVLRYNVAQALRLAGHVDRAAELIDPMTEGIPVPRIFGLHSERALLDLLRGRFDTEAIERYAMVDPSQFDGLANLIESTDAFAAASLWSGRPQMALDRLLIVIRRAVRTDASAFIGPLLCLAARAAADKMEISADLDHDRDRLLHTLRDLRDATARDPFRPSLAFGANKALAATWAAEIARLAGQPSVDRWTRAANEWHQLPRPHDEAYCLWRAGQSALTRGQATTGAKLLRRARVLAHQHVPLRNAIVGATTTARPA